MDLRYRYQEALSEDGIHIHLIEFVEVKKTTKGCWVSERNWRFDKDKFVLDGTGKRHCHQTKDMAWDAFILRKKAHVRHARNSLDIAQFALDTAVKLGEAPTETVYAGRPQFFEKYSFE